MGQQALGLIETIGFTTALAAVDAATKAADVSFLGYERVIGVGKAVSIAAKMEGEVAAVQAAIAAGEAAANNVGKVVATHVIPRPHPELEKIINTPETKESIIKKKGKQEKQKKSGKKADNKKNNIKQKDEK